MVNSGAAPRPGTKSLLLSALGDPGSRNMCHGSPRLFDWRLIAEDIAENGTLRFLLQLELPRTQWSVYHWAGEGTRVTPPSLRLITSSYPLSLTLCRLL